jgi:phage head maturation protease
VKRRTVALLSLSALAALASCGTKDDPIKTAFDHTETQVEAVSSANTVQCSIDHNALMIAVETYETIVGEPPTAETDLVAQGVIRKESPSYNLDANGAVVADPSGGCAA